jgi:O-antigen/teichoic acid export membrane protein
MSGHKLVIRNIFSNWTSSIVCGVMAFFIMPFLVHHLGDTLYGIWILVISTTGYGVLLDFGIRSSIIKYVSQYNATGDKASISSIFSTSILLYSIAGAILMVISFCFAPFLTRLFVIPPQYDIEVKIVFLVICLNLALKFPGGVLEGFLSGLQRYDITNGIVIFREVLKAAAIVVWVGMGYKLLVLALIVFVGDLLGSCLMALFCVKQFPFLRLSLSSVNRQMFMKIFRFGLYSFLNLVGGRFLYESDPIVIGLFLPSSAITLYAVANNLIRYLREFAYGFGNVFSPAASELEVKNERDRMESLMIFGSKYLLLIVLPIVAGCVILGKEFFLLWMGARYAESSALILAILSVSQAAAMAQFSSGAMLYGLNRHRYLGFLLLAEAFVKLTISIILIKPLGIIGVALGTAIPDVIVNTLVLPRYCCKIIELSFVRYIKRAILPPLQSVIPFVCLLLLLKIELRPLSWHMFVGEISVGLLVYGVTAFYICLNGKQRAFFANSLMTKFRNLSTTS